MVVNRRWTPTDTCVAAYNLLLAAIWWANWREAACAPWIAVAHVAGVGLPSLFAEAPRHRRGLMRTLREIYPLILLLGFWTELDLLRGVLGPEGFDAQVRALDLAVFGVHLHAVLLPRLDALWLSEPMYCAYYAYYGLIFLPPLVLAVLGRRRALRDLTLRLMVAYMTCYVVYIVFPVYGPRLTDTLFQGPHTTGFFYHLVASAQNAGDSAGSSFPSSHVAGAVTIAIVAWRWFPRWIAGAMIVEAAAIVVATVYTQNHYGIDALSGLMWALATQFLLVPALTGKLRMARARRTSTSSRLAPAFRPADSLGGIS